MDNVQRTILFNQYEILKLLDPDEKDNYELYQEIIANGFSKEYPIFMRTMAEEELDASVQDEVIDKLSMFRALYNKKLKGWTPSVKDAAEFGGFDGNHDPHYGYAQHILKRQKKIEESARIINSHSSSTLTKYRRMLEVWDNFGRSQDLTDTQAEEIISA